MRVRHQTSMFARRGVVVYAVYAPDSHLSFRFAAALYRVLQALSVDFSNVQLPKILGKFSVKSSTSNKVISGNWFTYTMVDSLFPSRWKPYPNPKYSNSANASTARRSSSWMELMSWMIISMLMLCLSKITCCLFVGLGVFALLGLGVGLPSPDWSLFFVSQIWVFKLDSPIPQHCHNLNMGDVCCLQKQRIRWGTDLCWKIGWMSRPPCAWLIFRADTPWFPWSPNSHCGNEKRNKQWWGSWEKDNNYNYPITSFNFGAQKCLLFLVGKLICVKLWVCFYRFFSIFW